MMDEAKGRTAEGGHPTGHPTSVPPGFRGLDPNQRVRLHHFQNERYHLACWVIMPNHCHLVIRSFDGHDLEDLKLF